MIAKLPDGSEFSFKFEIEMPDELRQLGHVQVLSGREDWVLEDKQALR